MRYFFTNIAGFRELTFKHRNILGKFKKNVELSILHEYLVHNDMVVEGTDGELVFASRDVKR